MFDPIVHWLNELAGMNFSIHGWVAILLTIIGVCAFSFGLMYLTHRSHTSGHDKQVDDFNSQQNPDRDD